MTLSLIRVWPRRAFGALAAALVVVVRPFARKEIARIQANVERVYGLRAGTPFARQFERQNLDHLVRSTLETIRGIQDPDSFDVVGFEALKARVVEIEAAGKGVIIVTAHVGSWELCAFFGRLAVAKRFHVLAKPSRNVKAQVALARLRNAMNVDVLWTDRKSLLRDMLKTLKTGEALGFVMDQKPEGRHGPIVEFLGIPTEFVAGPAAMAARTGAGVVAIFCLREGPFRFRIVSETLAAPNGVAAGEESERVFTQTMANAITDVIRAYPEQWTWNYKRWRG